MPKRKRSSSSVYRRRQRKRARTARRYNLSRFVASGQPVHSFKRNGAPTALTVATSDSFFGFAVSASGITNYTEFSSLFDQYRITKVVFRYLPNFTEGLWSMTLSNTQANQRPWIYSIIDRDNTPTSTLSYYLEYPNLKTLDPFKRHKWTCYPYPVEVSGQFAASNRKRWIDWSAPATAYYSLNIAIPGSAYVSTSAVVGAIYPTFYFDCKNVR